jgi:hypothetical protein
MEHARGAPDSSGKVRARVAALIVACALCAIPEAFADPTWHFAVSGDSRNCGNVVIPSIAAGARADHAAFFWHLGDLRAIYDFDEDFRAQHPNANIAEYLNTAWLDVGRNQIESFGALPFYLGIGNHETIPPKSRDEYVATFADWLDAPAIRDQRLKDDAHDHKVRTYYHWIHDGVDFISLDNASTHQFDAPQLQWLATVLQNDQHDPAVRALVVGMHEALPESLARNHSMSDAPTAEATGLQVYGALLEVQKTKPVYVLASHSHFVMQGIFDTPYWHEHGGVLPGWIIGTAGAVRYPLPPAASQSPFARTHVYGYLLGTVTEGHAKDPIRFEFREVTEAVVPADIVERYGAEFVHRCYQENSHN